MPTLPSETIEVTFEPGVKHFADRPVVLSVFDPGGRLGLRPNLELKREGRVPDRVSRSFLIDRTGRGTFYGWMPVQFAGAELVPDQATATVSSDQQPKIFVKRLSVTGAMSRLLLWRFTAMIAIVRLIIVGNFKGAVFRFVRQFDGLSEPNYHEWIWAQEVAECADGSEMRDDWTLPPTLLITLDGESASDLAATRESLARQSWPYFAEAGASEVQRQFDTPQHLPILWMRLSAGTQLAPRSLERMIRPFVQSDDVTAVYCDEDYIDEKGRRYKPFFKPAWNEPLARSGWLTLDGAIIRLSAMPREQEFATKKSHELVAIAARTKFNSVVHVPRVLLHRKPEFLPPRQPPSLDRYVETKVQVSVIIPTRDRADLLQACLKGLFERTLPGELDVILVDNDTDQPEALELMENYERSGHLRRIQLPGAFNFARACNLGVEAARYDHILLLNNDVEPISPNWLAALVNELSDSTIGAVGNLLLFPDGYVQHGGVTIGAGTVARHTFHFHDPVSAVGRNLLQHRRDVSAVTAACMLTRKALWSQVGGMDEVNLTVAFNDVDYCLKLREAGYRIVWTPIASMTHRESVSRGHDNTLSKRLRFESEERVMFERWGQRLQMDPHYSPNLSLAAEIDTIEAHPRSLDARWAL